MKNILAFAQKGLIFDETRTKILTIKYGNAKYVSESVSNRYGLPGGKMDFGENVDESFIREVKEETGVTITPGNPFHIYSWIYKKENYQVQIIALARFGFYESGEIHKKSREEKETTIESVQWIDLDQLDAEKFTLDENPVIKKFLKLIKNNSLKELQ